MLVGARLIAVVAVVAVVSVACTSSETDDTTSTLSGVSLTTLPGSGTTDAPQDTTTTVTAEPKSVLTPPEYQIVDRVSGEGEGDTVIVLLDPESYDSLTDLDLYDLIAEIVELFPPIASAHVVDDIAAANVIGNPDASEAERQAIVANYLARLDDGFKITYLGPFASSGTAVLGS